MKKAIYTAIFGNYDKFQEAKYINNDYDYHLFTDDRNIQSDIYKIHILSGDALKAREIKLLPFNYLPNYDYSVWMDGNIVQCRDMNDLKSTQTTDFMTMKHHIRGCIYEELQACIDLNKGSVDIMQKQINKYQRNGFRPNMGLIASGLLFRHHTDKVKQLCKNWWDEVKTGSLRDQLSFNYILDQQIDLLPFSVLKSHFIYTGHHQR